MIIMDIIEIENIKARAKKIATAAILSDLRVFEDIYPKTVDLLNKEFENNDSGIPAHMFSSIVICSAALIEINGMLKTLIAARTGIRNDSLFEAIQELNHYEVMILTDIEQKAHEKICRLD
jgi:hypothetical protein